MLVVGIDIGAESHHVAVVDRAEAVVVKATAFAENVAGYQELFALLARAGARGGADLPLATASVPPQSTLVVMEATGHYWQNLFAALMARGLAVALVNPLRTHRFAGEELARTKTDRIDRAETSRCRPSAGSSSRGIARTGAAARAVNAGDGRADQSASSAAGFRISRVHPLSQRPQYGARYRDPAAVPNRPSLSRSLA
jgi:hypothetical protein